MRRSVHAHSHTHAATRWLKVALIITLALAATEFVAGSLAHSLSIVSDGWHNLSDAPSLIFAALAIYFERRPPTEERTFGYQRAGVLAAFVNALILTGVAALICYEGYTRIVHPEPVASEVMLIVGAVALAVNAAITVGLARGREEINLRAIFIHNLGDALSNVAIIVGGWIIAVTGARIVDPLLAFLIAGMIFWGAIGILGESLGILLESSPKGITAGEVASAMLEIEGVQEVHDVHIWSLNPHSHALACHVRILDMPTSETEKIIPRIKDALAARFGITHCTIQFEHTHPPGEFHTYMPHPAPMRRKP
ncbi:MAG: cation diffusion facilitator family transporter [Terriglobia bacterium]